MALNQDQLQETGLLEASWSYKRPYLKSYLVQGYHDPRINIQSVLTRHFLIRKLFQNQFDGLCDSELHFAIEMNKRLNDQKRLRDSLFLEYLSSGMELKQACHLAEEESRVKIESPFEQQWSSALAHMSAPRISVVEAACGSANDYRFFKTYGIARFIDYTGFDISEGNIANAKEMFPEVAFEKANIFDLKYIDRSFDYLIAHDLFEHFSLKALEVALSEAARITRLEMAIAFFNMASIKKHQVKPLRKYHWNLLSQNRIHSSLSKYGFQSDSLHIDSWLAAEYNFYDHDNPFEFTFFSSKVELDD